MATCDLSLTPSRNFFVVLTVATAALLTDQHQALAETSDASTESAATTEIVVTGLPAGDTLSQAAPVGPYDQPEWTTLRTFGANRVYVRPPGTVEFVNFWTPEFKGGDSEHAFRHELEVGLPYRFQLDLYQNWGIDEAGRSFYKGSSVELRYALADWGKIPLNPTLYAEWYFNDNAPDAFELKLLLGETFAKRWNWAANFTFEQETGGERGTEIALSSALSYALIDRKLNVGIEVLAERATTRETRNDPELGLLAGPSVNLRPTPNTFITAAPLFGLTGDAPKVEVFVVAGFQFRFGGPRGATEAQGPRAPASMFGR